MCTCDKSVEENNNSGVSELSTTANTENVKVYFASNTLCDETCQMNTAS